MEKEENLQHLQLQVQLIQEAEEEAELIVVQLHHVEQQEDQESLL